MTVHMQPLTVEEHRARHLRIVGTWLIGNLIIVLWSLIFAATRAFEVIGP